MVPAKISRGQSGQMCLEERVIEEELLEPVQTVDFFVYLDLLDRDAIYVGDVGVLQ